MEAGNRTFDPDELPIGEDDADRPTITVAEAIQILKLGAGRAAATADPVYEPYNMEEMRVRIEKKMRALGMLDEEEKLAAGWTRVGDDWIPPG